MRKVTVLSKVALKEWLDKGLVKDQIVISIESTDACLNYWVNERGDTNFNNDHLLPPSKNTLNLHFDDVQEDTIMGRYELKAITPEQAKKIIDFIKENPDKDVIVQCMAGQSRSQGVGKFLKLQLRYEGNVNTDTASYRVYRTLMDALGE